MSRLVTLFFFFSSRRRHTRFDCDWSSDVCSSDLSPGEKRQAQIDGRGVQGIHRLGQLHSERLVAVEVASGGNQNLSEIGVDPPVAVLVGVGQRSEEHTSELQSQSNLVCRLLLEKKKKNLSNSNSDLTYI